MSSLCFYGVVSARTFGWTPTSGLCFARPTQGPRRPEHHKHQAEGRWRRPPAPLVQMPSRRREETPSEAEGKEGDTTSNLLLKHPDTILAT